MILYLISSTKYHIFLFSRLCVSSSIFRLKIKIKISKQRIWRYFTSSTSRITRSITLTLKREFQILTRAILTSCWLIRASSFFNLPRHRVANASYLLQNSPRGLCRVSEKNLLRFKAKQPNTALLQIWSSR
jgi:hypothetical protein